MDEFLSGQIRRAYSYTGSVQVGKYSAVSVSNGGAGFALPSGLNVPALGILLQAIVPVGGIDRPNGSYEGVSQAPWPTAFFYPPSPVGWRETVVIGGPVYARAAGAWSREDRLVTADNLGHLASVVTLGLAAGTRIFVVATADQPAEELGDVAIVLVLPHWDAV
jgi:hypothetical protein